RRALNRAASRPPDLAGAGVGDAAAGVIAAGAAVAGAAVAGAAVALGDPLAGALLHGVDFTSAPSRRKPIVVASGRPHANGLRLERIERIVDLAGFEAFLARPGPWLGVFDLPFGLPRPFIEA